MNLWFIIAHENAIFSVAPLVNYLLAKHLEAATARYLIVFMVLVSKGGEVWPFWWFLAFPLALAGVNRAVEIERVFTRVRENGERRIETNLQQLLDDVEQYRIELDEEQPTLVKKP